MKKYTLLTLCFLFSCFSNAQVGIGTANPDVSSLLDLTSTTQGLLTPRMTSAQRIAISDPAEGLLVFDTDENAFYFYDSAVWSVLEGAVKRNNYKLVKSIADLAQELSDGGGSKYKLDENYMYEINGTINFDFPVDLNGSYLEGHDTGEDILINASGSPLFSGDKGGRLKDLIIDGGGQQIFNITGSGTESMVGYSLIIKNASSVGTLNSLFAVFFEVLQVVDSDNGLNVSDITSFFMDKIFWTDGNIGTFLTLAGSFSNLQIANGRVVVDSGETGINVSTNPTINVSASFTGVSFSGLGDRVNGYTVGSYDESNFTSFWDVDCPGIPIEKDAFATGDIISGAAYGSGIFTNFINTGSSSRKKIVGTTTSNNLLRFAAPVENKIVYEGKQTRYFSVHTSISFRGQVDGDVFVFYIAKGNNGDLVATVDESTKVYREIGAANDIGAVAIVGSIELAPGDFIEVWTERYAGTGNLLVTSMNLVVR